MNHTLIPEVVLNFSPECCHEYAGMAFDGEFYFLTVPNELKICRFSRDFMFCGCVDTYQPYGAICYDSSECVFWALNKKSGQMLTSLDRNLNETGSVELCQCGKNCGEITGLSYHSQSDTFLVSFANEVVEYEKNGQPLKILEQTDRGFISSVLAIPPCYALASTCASKQFIDIFSSQGQLIRYIRFPVTFKILDFVSHACSEQAGCGNVTVLTILAMEPCCRPCIVRCKLGGGGVCKESGDCNCRGDGDGGCKCGYGWNRGESDCKCGCNRNGGCNDCNCDCKCKGGCDDCNCGCKCKGGCDDCNCGYNCKGGCDDCNCDCNCNGNCCNDCTCGDCQESLCRLLESIALMEVALSRILHAEGEKMQKAIQLADNICELIEIDRVVNQTITKITFLEQTLYAKLEAVAGLKEKGDAGGCP